jgi:plasmid stabilization system protein ParE
MIPPSADDGRPSDRAILESVAATLRAVVDDDRLDDATRITLVQTIALAELAAHRGDDPAPQRRNELESALESIAANPYVAKYVPGDPYSVATRALVDAVGRDDTAADELRHVIRPVLIGHLDADLAVAGPLLDAFRGSLRNA